MRKSIFFLPLALASILASSSPAQTAQTASAAAKRPMTFEDMMQMKRLGETAVSPDSRWLAYAATTVNLEQNTETTNLFIQFIGGGEPKPLPVAQPGDRGPQFSPDGKHILFLSSRDGSQQVWVADFNSSDGSTSNPKKLTAISTEADNAIWSPDSHSVVFTSAVYPDCPAITAARRGDRRQMQCRSGCGAGLEQGQGDGLYPPALPPLGPLHRRQAQPSVPGNGGDRGDARSDAQRSPQRPARISLGASRAADALFRPTRRSWPLRRTSTKSRQSASMATSLP